VEEIAKFKFIQALTAFKKREILIALGGLFIFGIYFVQQARDAVAQFKSWFLL
jgi:hypothetical protein